jgi:hypothetical protein
MNGDSAVHRQAHPAPHRARVGLVPIWFAILAGPLAWSTQLLVNSTIAAHGCYPHDMPIASSIWGNAHGVMAGIEIAALVLCVWAGLTGWRNWRRTREEKGGSAHHLLEGGDGRTRFMSMVGMLTSALFLVAVAFSALNLTAVPACGG